jgi:hypothetical protein
MSDPAQRLSERLRREELLVCERSPELHAEILRRLEASPPPEEVEPLLDQALAGQRTVESSLAAARLARKLLDPHLLPEEVKRLDEMEALVRSRALGPSVLKSEVYLLARARHVAALLATTWFDELFDRVETRRMTDHDASL